MKGKNSPFELDLDVIKGPLERVLNLPIPVKEVLQRLNYIDLYLPLSEVSLYDLMDINWQLPEKFHRTGIRTIARDMVMEDYRIFQKLNHLYVNNFAIHHLLQRMRHQWQFLCFTTKSISFDPVMRNKLTKLVKV